MKTVSSQVLVATFFALSVSLVVSPVALSAEVLINSQTGAVRVLGRAPSNQAALQSNPLDKSESTREARAQTAKQIAERKIVDGLPVGTLLAITTSSDGSVSQVVPLIGERARVMDRPFQKNGSQASISEVLYTLPNFLTPSSSAKNVDVQVWKKVGDRQFSWLVAL